MEYVIIGNSAAGVGGVEGIRSVDREGKITVISIEKHHVYSRPLISYLLQGKVSEEGMYYRGKDFYDKNDVDVILGVGAEKIDTKSKEVFLASGRRIPYDRLLIATGGKPIVPPIRGMEGKAGIFTFIKKDDVLKLENYLKEGSRAVIIGGGLIGLKAAEALACRGLDVTVVELAGRILGSILDEEAASMVQERLQEKGIKVITGNTVVEVEGEERVSGVILRDGIKLECEILIIAIGVLPNADIARNSGIEVSRGIVVNSRMETSAKDIYAAGDVAEGPELISDGRRVIPIWPNAYNQGYTAGVNMAGGEAEFGGGFQMNSISFFDLPMITAGVVKAPEPGYEEMVFSDRKSRIYRKVVIRDGKLVGFIKLGDIDRAGIYTNLIREKLDVVSFRDRLLDPDFGYRYLPAEYRREKLRK